MKDKTKAFVKSLYFRVAVMCCFVVMLLTVSAFAEEAGTASTTATVISAFQTGFQQIATDSMQLIAVAVPIGLGVAGLLFLVRKAMSWFKSMAK